QNRTQVLPGGKPHITPKLSSNQVSALVRDTVRQGYEQLDSVPPLSPGVEDPVVVMEKGKPITANKISSAFAPISQRGSISPEVFDEGFKVIKGKLGEYADEAVRT